MSANTSEPAVMRGAVRAVAAAGPMVAHFALCEVREGAFEVPVMLANSAGGEACLFGGHKVGAARGATAYEALARAQMFAASLELADALKELLAVAELNMRGEAGVQMKAARYLLARLPGYTLSPKTNSTPQPQAPVTSRLDLTKDGGREEVRG